MALIEHDTPPLDAREGVGLAVHLSGAPLHVADQRLVVRDDQVAARQVRNIAGAARAMILLNREALACHLATRLRHPLVHDRGL